MPTHTRVAQTANSKTNPRTDQSTIPHANSTHSTGEYGTNSSTPQQGCGDANTPADITTTTM
eukprot:12935551-Prorocentrum_lima.AAC.1